MTQPKLKMKTGDKVQVIAGKNKGAEGVIKQVLRAENRVVVEGVNVVQRAQKPSALNPQGGMVAKELPLHISNVAYLDPKENKPTKIGYKTLKDGKKVRFAKLSGEEIDS